jgi:hypothetical protein
MHTANGHPEATQPPRVTSRPGASRLETAEASEDDKSVAGSDHAQAKKGKDTNAVAHDLARLLIATLGSHAPGQRR